VLQCVAVCCSVLQCVAVCCSVLQCVAGATTKRLSMSLFKSPFHVYRPINHFFRVYKSPYHMCRFLFHICRSLQFIFLNVRDFAGVHAPGPPFCHNGLPHIVACQMYTVTHIYPDFSKKYTHTHKHKHTHTCTHTHTHR